MASGMYNKGLREILDGTIDPDTDVLKLVLVDNTYVYNADHEVFDTGTNDVNDPSFCELSCTNYTPGWGSASRKAPTVAIAEDDGTNRVNISIADLTWTALGGAANDTVGGVILLKEGGANDTTSRLLAWFDLADTATNGSDVTLNFDATANIYFGV